MRYGVLGTGQVGRALAGRLVDVGHEVRMGSRTPGNEAAAAWPKPRRRKAKRKRAQALRARRNCLTAIT